jgi:hypothetical protein
LPLSVLLLVLLLSVAVLLPVLLLSVVLLLLVLLLGVEDMSGLVALEVAEVLDEDGSVVPEGWVPAGVVVLLSLLPAPPLVCA